MAVTHTGRRAGGRRSLASRPASEIAVGRRSSVKKRKGPARDSFTVNATEAKNRFGVILQRVRNADPVFIEKHGARYAVLLDIDSYENLVHKAREPHEIQLDSLKQEFDALYAAMQTQRSRAATMRLSDATPEQLNETAASRAKARG